MPSQRPKRRTARSPQDPARAFATLSRSVVDAALAGGKRAAKAGKPKRMPAVSDLGDPRALQRALVAAVKLGRAQADWVLERARSERERVARRRGRARAAMVHGGVLVAEGDSWFHYPFHDVLRLLRSEFGYTVEHVAHYGHAVESMAYDGGQLDAFEDLITRVIARGDIPKAILLSGGGNDIAGDGFAMLLNHRDSPARGLNAAVLQGVIETRILVAYATILTAVTRLCEQLTGQALPILLHSYAPPVPDGRGFWGGLGFLPGPWLEPGFRVKRYEDLGERIAIAKVLIDTFHAALARLAGSPPFAHVRLVDLRPLLSHALDDYRQDWDNELHPTWSGFRRIAKRFDDEIATL